MNKSGKFFIEYKKLIPPALPAVFETVRKYLFKQPVEGNLPVTGCLVSFEYGYCYNN